MHFFSNTFNNNVFMERRGLSHIRLNKSGVLPKNFLYTLQREHVNWRKYILSLIFQL